MITDRKKGMACDVKRLTPFRLLSIYAYDTLGAGHNMVAQIEVDVTDVRRKLRMERKAGNQVSFFGFLLSAIAKTMDEKQGVQSNKVWEKELLFP